eukprot:4824595-Pleurochrysis_carterae.AAC.2
MAWCVQVRSVRQSRSVSFGASVAGRVRGLGEAGWCVGGDGWQVAHAGVTDVQSAMHVRRCVVSRHHMNVGGCACGVHR